MAGVRAPKADDDEKAKAMAVHQVRKFLEAAQGTRFDYLFRLAFHAGCRPGELLALKWDDLDEDAATLRIDQNIVFRKKGDWYLKAPKTRRSRRVIRLTGELLILLRTQRDFQILTKNGSRSWTEYGFIFSKDNGEPWAQWNLYDDFKMILDKAKLPEDFNPYSARHTSATWLMAAGVHPKLVSDQLGHSRIGITLDTYTHPDDDMRAGLTAEIERILELGNTQATKKKPPES